MVSYEFPDIGYGEWEGEKEDQGKNKEEKYNKFGDLKNTTNSGRNKVKLEKKLTLKSSYIFREI